jgi:hypothetical protein
MLSIVYFKLRVIPQKHRATFIIVFIEHFKLTITTKIENYKF